MKIAEMIAHLEKYDFQGWLDDDEVIRFKAEWFRSLTHLRNLEKQRLILLKRGITDVGLYERTNDTAGNKENTM